MQQVIYLRLAPQNLWLLPEKRGVRILADPFHDQKFIAPVLMDETCDGQPDSKTSTNRFKFLRESGD